MVRSAELRHLVQPALHRSNLLLEALQFIRLLSRFRLGRLRRRRGRAAACGGEWREHAHGVLEQLHVAAGLLPDGLHWRGKLYEDRESTRLNSSPQESTYAGFCFKTT